MKRVAIFLYFLLFSDFLHSQTDSSEFKAMFDDGNISNAKNIMKINPTAFVVGDIPVHYERVIFNTLTMEVGLGYLRNVETFELFIPYESQPAKGTGLSVYVNPRVFLGRKAPEGYYLGLLYRRRKFSCGQVHNDLAVNNGIQFALKRVVFEIMYGWGFRIIDYPKSNSGQYHALEKIKLIFPASIKIGYKF